MHISYLVSKIIHNTDYAMRELAYKSPLAEFLYRNIVVKIKNIYFAEDERLFGGGSYKEHLLNALNMSNHSSDDSFDIKHDMKMCYYLYKLHPEEYIWYGFSKTNAEYRQKFLTDELRWEYCMKAMGGAAFDELRNKKTFYLLTKSFFNRDVCIIESDVDKQTFLHFAENHKNFFAKPLTGTLGADAGIVSVNGEKEKCFNELIAKGSWILEECIIQTPILAQWNESSVNTVRIPSFRTSSGISILQPFMRTGRKGAMVDNAGAGGIFAAIDENTGIVISDGTNETGEYYSHHPDSNLQYKGWQIPDWNDLVSLTKEIHLSLPSHHKYVGFDFAHTEKGWILIEGNWGQMVGQIATKKGVRKEFKRYLGL